MKFKMVLFLSLLIIPFFTDVLEAQSFQTGKIAVTMSDYGRVRVMKDSIAGVREIDRSSFLGVVNPNFVFSYWLSADIEDSMKTIENPEISDYEVYGSINNAYDTTGESPDFIVKHNVYGWENTAFLLVKFTVLNRESAAQETVLGMEIISEIDGSYGLETVYWEPASHIVAQYRPPASTYVGYKLLSAPTTTVKMIDWYDGYNTVNPDLFNWMTYGIIDTFFESGGDGAVTFFSKDAVTINASDSSVMWVGISIGADEAEMITNMNLAEAKYQTVNSLNENNQSLPSQYVLSQNYPNPFNPATSISFSIPKQEYVSLKVFDVLGNLVADLVNRDLIPGSYIYNFDATGLSSGIYFYRLTTGSYSETKKMNLLK